MRWPSRIFNRNACVYQTATRWGLPPYRITIWMIDDAMFACLLDELILSFCYSDLRLETGGLTKCASLSIHTPSYSCTYRHKHIYIPKHIHSCKYTNIHLYTLTYILMHSLVLAFIYTNICRYAFTHTYTYKNTLCIIVFSLILSLSILLFCDMFLFYSHLLSKP